jgi:predicted peptidase
LLSKAKVSTLSNREVTKAVGQESVQDKTREGYLPNPMATDCFDALGYRYTGGRYDNELIRFRLRCPPKIVPGKKYPLVVWFHGKGESGDDNERQLAHLQYTLPFLTGPKSLDFFMLVTQCPKDNPLWETTVSTEGKGDAPVTIAMEIFDHLLDEYPIDKNRISTFGQCSGATGSWIFIEKYPDLVAAITSVCANPPKGVSIKDLAISAFNCTDDPRIAIQPMRDYIKQVNAASGNAYLTEIVSTSHDAWTPALTQYKVIAWMITQTKGSSLSPPPGVVLDPQPWADVCWYFGPPVCCIILFSFVRLRQRKC